MALTQLTLLNNLPSVRVDITFVTLGNTEEENQLFARTGCHVIELTNPLEIGVIIATKLYMYRYPWPEIGILMDTSGSMGTAM